MRIIKYGAFILLTLVSAYLSVNMLVSLGADLAGKIVLGFVSIALESTKVFALLRIEYSMFQRSKNKLLRRPWNSILIYAALASLSIIASLGFTLVTVDRQVEVSRVVFTSVSEDYSFDIEQLQSSLSLVDSQIVALQAQLGGINPDYATGSVRISTEATKLSDKRAALVAEISRLKKAQRESITAAATSSGEQNVYGMFVLMGNIVGVGEKSIMTFLLLLISVLLEVGMIYTSPTITIPGKEIHEMVHEAEAPKKREYKKREVKSPEPVKAETIKRLPAVASPTGAGLQLHANSPHIITKQIRMPTTEADLKNLLQKILQPIRGTELKSAADLSADLNIPVEKINELFNWIGKLKGASGPLLSQKDAAWHLNYMKDLTISIVLRSPAIITLLKGIENVSKAK